MIYSLTSVGSTGQLSISYPLNMKNWMFLNYFIFWYIDIYCTFWKLPSIAYGATIFLEKNRPRDVTKEECQTLSRTGVINFQGHRIQMTKTKFDSFDLTIKGRRNAPNGYCGGTTFTYDRDFYYSHVLTATVEVSVTEENYLVKNNMIFIDYTAVPMTDKFFLAADYTLIW